MLFYKLLCILILTSSINADFNYIYIGCFEDRVVRDMRGLKTQIKDMYWHQCITLCKDMNFHYAGLQFGDWCFCDNSFGSYGRVSDSECNVPCAGNYLHPEGHHWCGGALRNNVYRIPTFQYPKPMPTTPPPTVYNNYIGCYDDDGQIRDLHGSTMHSNIQTLEQCFGFCWTNNYQYAGLQNSHTCFCGNTYGLYGRRFDWDCKMSCNGNSQQNCGDFGRNAIYSVPTAYTWRGDTLYQGEVLPRFHALRSQNGRYSAQMKPDGNFVVFDHEQNRNRWTTNSVVNGGEKLILQTDGNLVVVRGIYDVVWKTGKYTNSGKDEGFRLVMQNDGNLVNAYASGQLIWWCCKGQ